MIKFVGHKEFTWMTRNACRVMVGKPEGNRNFTTVSDGILLKWLFTT
jgi:hypothetical protein